jgi:hypothetical protein
MFDNGQRFTGERGLGSFECGAFQHARVSSHRVAGREHQHVARHEVARRDELLPPIAQYAGAQGGEFAQRLHRTFGPAFVPGTKERIHEHNDEDHAGVTCPADGSGNACGDEQEIDKRIGELADENGDPRTAFGFLQGIRAMCSEATLCLLRQDALRGAAKPPKHSFARHRVPLGPSIRVPRRRGIARVVGLCHGRSTRRREPDRNACEFGEIPRGTSVGEGLHLRAGADNSGSASVSVAHQQQPKSLNARMRPSRTCIRR